jgi:hypothetical protein
MTVSNIHKNQRFFSENKVTLLTAFVSCFSWFLVAAALLNANEAVAANPQLAMRSTELKKVGATYFGYFNLKVTNYSEFSADLFTPAPNLPPCGANANSARTWVNIYNGATRAYIYGFCALSKPSDLQSIWFGLAWGSPIPTSIYIELNDRLTGTIYRSNLLPL